MNCVVPGLHVKWNNCATVIVMITMQAVAVSRYFL